MPKKGEIDLQRLQYWKAVLAKHKESGLSGPVFCRENDIPYTAFVNRRRRMGSLTNQSTQPEFAKIEIKKEEQSLLALADRLEVILPNGVLVRVPHGYSASALIDLFLTLGSCKC